MRLTFRKKALLFVLPILGIVSIVYTYEAIRTEKEITRTEIIKRAEAITRLATKTGELPILSRVPEFLESTVSSLKDNSEVASVTFYDNKMKLLVHDGPPVSEQVSALSPEVPISMSDEKDMFVFFAPVFTVRVGEEVDILQDAQPARKLREHIGWVRLGFSKAAMNKSIEEVVVRGFALAIIFTVGSSVAVFFLITIVTKPLMVLFNATKKLEKGEYPDVGEISSTDEIGLLASAFKKMSVAIKERESRLMESENRIRELFERVEHAIFSLDKDGNIIEANSKFYDLFGKVDMLSDILGDDTVRNCFQGASSGSAFHWEEKGRGKDNSELIILLSLYPKIAQDDTITGLDGYIVDITEKKLLEERLIRSQKMEAIGTLAGGIAHDFNNLLQAILGYSEVMLEETKEDDPLHKPIKVIHSAAKKGAHLTKTILSVTRKEKMEVKDVDINEIVQSSMELLQRSIPKNIEIIVNLEEGIPIMMADPSHLEQVILNLAVNARDAMPDGGRLTIETAMVERSNDFAFGGPAGRHKYVKLSVADTGTGMDKETQGRIFEPFFTTKEVGKGTGLGLYTVHSIVDNHRGYINLHSERGKGTRFNIYVPVEKSKVIEKPAESRELRGSETILVIDDDESVRDTYNDMLSPLGYEILLANGGVEGTEIFRRMKDNISLVLLDMLMPHASGGEVFELLRTIHPEVKILLCSGYNQDGYADIDNLLKAGANGFIQKPFTRRDIALAIRKALRGSH